MRLTAQVGLHLIALQQSQSLRIQVNAYLSESRIAVANVCSVCHSQHALTQPKVPVGTFGKEEPPPLPDDSLNPASKSGHHPFVASNVCCVMCPGKQLKRRQREYLTSMTMMIFLRRLSRHRRKQAPL